MAFTRESRVWWWRLTGRREDVTELERRLSGLDRGGMLSEYRDQKAEYSLRLLISIAGLSVLGVLYVSIVAQPYAPLVKESGPMLAQHRGEALGLTSLFVPLCYHFVMLFFFSLRNVRRYRNWMHDLVAERCGSQDVEGE